jgi:hypothetical protein
MTETTPDAHTDPSTATGFEAVRQNREALQEHAETGRPTAYLAEALLDLEAADAGVGE